MEEVTLMLSALSITPSALLLLNLDWLAKVNPTLDLGNLSVGGAAIVTVVVTRWMQTESLRHQYRQFVADQEANRIEDLSDRLALENPIARCNAIRHLAHLSLSHAAAIPGGHPFPHLAAHAQTLIQYAVADPDGRVRSRAAELVCHILKRLPKPGMPLYREWEAYSAQDVSDICAETKRLQAELLTEFDRLAGAAGNTLSLPPLRPRNAGEEAVWSAFLANRKISVPTTLHIAPRGSNPDPLFVIAEKLCNLRDILVAVLAARHSRIPAFRFPAFPRMGHRKYPEKLDLTGAFLSGAEVTNLSSVRLDQAHLEGANLIGPAWYVSIGNGHLNAARLSHEWREVSFTDAILHNVRVSEDTLWESVSLDGADVEGVEIHGGTFRTVTTSSVTGCPARLSGIWHPSIPSSAPLTQAEAIAKAFFPGSDQPNATISVQH